MKMYLVTAMTCDEYGCMTGVALFSTREKAQAYIDKQNDKKEEVWWSDEPIDSYEIKEYIVDTPSRECDD